MNSGPLSLLRVTQVHDSGTCNSRQPPGPLDFFELHADGKIYFGVIVAI